MPFVSLGLTPALCNPLAKLGYTTPTPVQLKSIPVGQADIENDDIRRMAVRECLPQCVRRCDPAG